MSNSGYTHCKCRECMEIVVSNDSTNPDYCDACADNCGPENTTFTECQKSNDEDWWEDGCEECGAADGYHRADCPLLTEGA